MLCGVGGWRVVFGERECVVFCFVCGVLACVVGGECGESVFFGERAVRVFCIRSVR